NELPGFLHAMPRAVRSRVNARSLTAGATAWLKPRFGGVEINAGRTIAFARRNGRRVVLGLDTGERDFDQVLLATGYRIDIAGPGFFSPSVLAAIARDGGSPILSRGFESNLPGLHFIGASAVRSYGPLLRFVAGSGYAAGEVTREIVARRPQKA